jgi:hypothetical protein
MISLFLLLFYVLIRSDGHVTVLIIPESGYKYHLNFKHSCSRAEIAKALTGSHYGFVFGCNMFLALVIESIFTAAVVDDVGLGVDVRTQVKVLYCSALMFVSILKMAESVIASKMAALYVGGYRYKFCFAVP